MTDAANIAFIPGVARPLKEQSFGNEAIQGSVISRQ
jgi:hypothetical protein